MIFSMKTTEGRFCPISAFRLVFSVAILILSSSLFPCYMQVKYCAKRVVTSLEVMQRKDEAYCRSSIFDIYVTETKHRVSMI